MIPGVPGPPPLYSGRQCHTCRWFCRSESSVIDGEVVHLGECGRPEGPLDPRLALGSQAPISARTRLVSSGMGCRAHEARDDEKVTKVTDSGAPGPDLWGRT